MLSSYIPAVVLCCCCHLCCYPLVLLVSSCLGGVLHCRSCVFQLLCVPADLLLCSWCLQCCHSLVLLVSYCVALSLLLPFSGVTGPLCSSCSPLKLLLFHMLLFSCVPVSLVFHLLLSSHAAVLIFYPPSFLHTLFPLLLCILSFPLHIYVFSYTILMCCFLWCCYSSRLLVLLLSRRLLSSCVAGILFSCLPVVLLSSCLAVLLYCRSHVLVAGQRIAFPSWVRKETPKVVTRD